MSYQQAVRGTQCFGVNLAGCTKLGLGLTGIFSGPIIAEDSVILLVDMSTS